MIAEEGKGVMITRVVDPERRPGCGGAGDRGGGSLVGERD